ncbi:MAG: hypothetical protein KDL31_09215 [Kiritimatiellae bacterium]|nr:hypothetical protein [Kiritimatiellia bacterium]
MMRHAGWGIGVCVVLAGLWVQGEESLSGPFPRAAQPLLNDVISRLPDIPLRIEGDLIVRKSTGQPEEQYKVDMELDWWATPPTAQYTLRDRFAAPLSHLSITWGDEGEPSRRYFQGDPLTAAPLPDLQAPLLDTDLSWIDLSLSFLWWRSGAILGAELVRGRECLIVDLPAPSDAPLTLGGVRLWIDPKIGMLLQGKASMNRGSEFAVWKSRASRRSRIAGSSRISNFGATPTPASPPCSGSAMSRTGNGLSCRRNRCVVVDAIEETTNGHQSTRMIRPSCLWVCWFACFACLDGSRAARRHVRFEWLIRNTTTRTIEWT